MRNKNHSKRLLLISNSTQYGSGYLDHYEGGIRDFLRVTSRVLFFPFALYDRVAYANKARARFAAMGYELDSILEPTGSEKAVARSQALFVGGGNTFRLLKAFYAFELVHAVRRQVEEGVPDIGASAAGPILAGPTIKTTQDMPIVDPPSFDALNLVPFQISPHYLDPDPASTHMGETQGERILQFLEENDAPLVGLREGAMLRVEDRWICLKGCAGARMFARSGAPIEARPGASLNDLLQAEGR